MSGEPFSIEFSVFASQIIKNYSLICSIRDTENRILVHSKKIGKKYEDIITPGGCYFNIEYPSLWLRNGVYTLEVKMIFDTASGENCRFVSSPYMVEVVGETDLGTMVGILTPKTYWSIGSITSTERMKGQ
jgi:hypothetical protein